MSTYISERRRALILAASLLDNPDLDPDADIVVLARQLTRAQEEIEALVAELPERES